jgi:dTDP-4-amino-4,6-dideoxygalactose transaminase
MLSKGVIMVPFVDLKAQYQKIKGEVLAAASGVFESTQFVLGPEVAAFEEEFAKYCQSRYGIGVNSGTSALHLALLAAGVGRGDEVITVPNTFVATVAAICYTGAKPILVDIDPRSFNMDVTKLEKAISDKTKVILPVHLYGQTVDMDPLMEIARRRRLLVIEDACQAHGSEYKGRRVGSIGDMGCFSFYPGKNLGAYGEGGMVVTNNSEYVRIIRMLRDWGAEKKYYHDLRGFNYRMEGVQGAILRVKLRYLEEWTEARRMHAEQYSRLLAGSSVITPEEMAYARHVYHIYAVRVTNRDAFQKKLLDRGVQTGIHYPIPVHFQRGYADLGYKKGDFPMAEKAAEEIVSLPMFAELSNEQIQSVIDAITNL